jgi:hypothetical protein
MHPAAEFSDSMNQQFQKDMRTALLAVWPSPPAQAAQVDGFDMLAHLQRQREWSGRTFGPGTRAQGVVDHIRKELCEIEADPGDLNEWIDVVILALDGAWRSGAQPHEIIDALVAKQTKNEGRVWPDWRTVDPTKSIEHDRSHDAPTAEPVAQSELPTEMSPNAAASYRLGWRDALAAQPRAMPKLDAEDWAVLQRLRNALPDVGLNGWHRGVTVLSKLLAAAPSPGESDTAAKEADR